MMLSLYRHEGFKSGVPVAGLVLVTFKGNKNKCTADAKKWLKENPQRVTPIYKWAD